MADDTDNHRLIVSLEARIRSYERAIEKAHRDTAKRMGGIEDALRRPQAEMSRLDRAGATMANGFSKSMGVASAAVGGLARGIIAGGAIAALGSFTGAIAKARSAIAEFDKISKTARTVGLSGETYQALSFGAVEASVSQEKLNTALSAFVRNAGMAATGKGELAEKLRQLNPELLRSIVNATTQEQRLRLVADALRGVAGASQRAALASAVFGESGVELVRVFQEGAAAIDEMKRKAKDLGLIVPDDLLQRSEELDNKLSVLSKIIDVNLSTALVKLAPLLVSASEGAASFAQEVNRISEAVSNFQRNPDLDSFLQIFGMALIDGGLADRFRDFVNEGLTEAKRTSGEIKAEIASIEDSIADLKALGEGDVFNASAIDRQLDRLGELRKELARVERSTAAASNNGGDSLQKLADSAGKALDSVSADIDAQAAEAERYQQIMNSIVAASNSVGAGNAYAEQTAALAEYVNKSKAAAAATDAISTAQEQLALIARNALRELGDSVDMNSAAYQRAQAELDRLSTGLVDNRVTADQVVDRLRSMEGALRALGVGESVISRLVAAFGTLASNILGAKAAPDAYNSTQVSYKVPGGTVGVTRHTIPQQSGSQQQRPIPRAELIPAPIDGKRAKGGPVKKGRAYLVGEEGPEIFTPDASGKIIPNDAIRPASGTPTSPDAPAITAPAPQGGPQAAKRPKGVSVTVEAAKPADGAGKPVAPNLTVNVETGKQEGLTAPGAKRRLADEYDAAQERGEVAKGRPKSVGDDNTFQPTAADLGLSRTDIHEARQIRDAEAAQPGIVGQAPSARIPGRDFLREIEQNTYDAITELRRAIGYLQTIESDQAAMLAAVRALPGDLGALWRSSVSTGSTGGSIGGMPSTRPAEGTSYDRRDRNAPYHYRDNPARGPSALNLYDPVADYTLNGNASALNLLNGRNIALDVFTGFRNPSTAEILSRQGPSVGQYGQGINITADPDFSGAPGGAGFFSNATSDSLRAVQDRYERAMGFNRGGMIHPGDSQRVTFFKNPKEAVGIFTPRQMEAMREAGYMDAGAGNSVSMGDVNIHVEGDAGGPQSRMRIADEVRAAVRNAVNEV